jgi:hypothetical protein
LLLNDVKNAERQYNDEHTGKEPLNHDYFCNELDKLKTAIEEFKMSIIKDTINDLQNASRGYDEYEIIDKISKHILMADFDEAINVITRYGREVIKK